MSLRRFYVEQDWVRQGDLIQLSPRESYHLERVLRLKVGQRCLVFNRKGSLAEAQIQTLSKERGTQLRLTQLLPSPPRCLDLQVAQALPQKRKMDHLVDWAQELGVRRLWVMETERSLKMKQGGRERARARWEKIVVEAAKQSRNPFLTEVAGPISFDRLIEETFHPGDKGFLFHPDADGLLFSEMITDVGAGFKPAPTIILFFGPEGGFTEEEVERAEGKGIRKVYLGDSILRIETAFLGVASALRFLALPGSAQ